MRIAFKEWAAVVDALGRGEQILILRKGGISEGRAGLQPEHPQFLLFPTRYHQQRESVIPSAQTRFDKIAPAFPGRDRVRLEFFCEVAACLRIGSLVAAGRLRGQHIWRDEVIARRFDWGRERNVHALAVRAYRLPQVVELPMFESYGGCKSWVELAREIDTNGAAPVLPDEPFAQKLDAFQDALEPTAATPIDREGRPETVPVDPGRHGNRPSRDP